MKNISCFSLILWTLILLMGCASYPVVRSGGVEIKSEDVRVKVAFGEADRRMIYDYYDRKYKQKKKKGMPPGLAKKEMLPPGLQKQLERNGTLPPGLAKRLLPSELEHQLSPLPSGYVRLKVSGDVILLHEPTQVIVDIIYNVG